VTEPVRDAEPAPDEGRPRDTLDDPVTATPSGWRAKSSRPYQLGSVALLLAAFGLVIASAVPAVARELGVTEVRVVTRDYVRSAPAGQAGVDAVRDFEKGIGRSVAELEMADEDDPPPSAALDNYAEGRAKIAVAARDLSLRDDPSRSAPVVGSAKRGQALVVLREDRGWVMVVQQTEHGLDVGWVAERDVVIP
jgi:hypothetical protein